MLARRRVIASAGALAAFPASAQSPDTFARCDAAMHRMVDDGKVAGVVTLVARGPKVVHRDVYGRMDVTRPDPLRIDSIFRIASMTKPVVGVAMMMLWEEGRWKLDDPVAQHIPEFANLKVRRADGPPVPMERPMLMWQLMSHLAGFGRLADYPGDAWRKGDLQGMIDWLATRPLYTQPGTEWAYGPVVDIQGYLVQKLSGRRLDLFLKDRIFDPVGMPDTAFWLRPDQYGRMVRAHTFRDGILVPATPTNSFRTSLPTYLSGTGGLASTAPDYMRFCQMLAAGGIAAGGRRLLRTSTVDLMHTNVAPPGVSVGLYDRNARGEGFGLDFAIVEDPSAARTAKPKGAWYWGGALGTWFWIDPANDLIFVGMIQNIHGYNPGSGTPIAREIAARAIYADRSLRRAPATSAQATAGGMRRTG